MEIIKVGSVFEVEDTVTEKNTAVAVGSGSLEVFATPMMIALMEKAASQCLQPFLQEGQSSVGTMVNIQHTGATPLGMKVRAKAEIVSVDRRKVVFTVEAFDERERIGFGEHERFVIDCEKFIEKINAK